MVKRGRKPKPAAAKKLAGNPGKRKPKKTPATSTPATMPKPPAWISAEAKAEWLRVGPLLAERGLLTELDAGVFTVYCNSWTMYLAAFKEVKKHGAVLTSEKGTAYSSPHMNILSGMMKQMVAIACEFGLTPASRERLTAVDLTEPYDPMTELLNQRRHFN